MRTRLFSLSLGACGFLFSLGSCANPELAGTCVISSNASPEERQAELKACLASSSVDAVDTRLKRDVDILFMIDNSLSMSPKQKVLAQNIPRFIQKIDATGANYHVNVITSDVGSLPSNSAPPAGWNDPRCNTFTGDDGALQAQPCTSRTGTGSEFQTACQNLCPDSRFVPTDGKRYISKQNGIINVPSLKDMTGQELGPQRAFQCMALVGDGGCGIESPLEAARRALDGHLSENSGFLRDDSVLAVISVAAVNDYHHPTPEAMTRLSQVGARLLRTDQGGTLTLRSRDGAPWTVEQAKGQGQNPPPLATIPPPQNAATSPSTPAPAAAATTATTYVGSQRSQVFHRADCAAGQKIVAANVLRWNSRAEALATGRRPAEDCQP